MSTTLNATQRQEPQNALQRLFDRLFAAAAISISVLLGLSATAKAEIFVRLQQVDAGGNPVSSVPANPDPAQKTLVYGRLLASGTIDASTPVTAFGTVVSWSAVGDAFVTDLITVNSAGVSAIGSSAMTVTGSGYFFPSGSGSEMNDNQLDDTFQRYLGIDSGTPFPSLGITFTDLLLMEIKFAVGPGIDDASFNFVLNGTFPDYGFFGVEPDFTVRPFTNQGGTIAVVPEPGTIPACLLGVVVIGGWMTQRSRRQRALSGPMAAAA